MLAKASFNFMLWVLSVMENLSEYRKWIPEEMRAHSTNGLA